MIRIDYSIRDDCKNPEESYGEICVHCNKCGRWGEREEADDTEE